MSAQHLPEHRGAGSNGKLSPAANHDRPAASVDLTAGRIEINLPDNFDRANLTPAAVEALLVRTYNALGIKDDRPYVRHDDRGYPYLRPGTSVDIITFTDCHDSETSARNQARHLGRKSNLVDATLHPKEPVENFSTTHLAVIVASFLGERSQIRPENQTPVLILGNAAPRSGSNPSSVGNIFVFAELPNNVFYAGTVEGLSLVKDQIAGGRVLEWNIEVQNATTVFRSRYLQETALDWCDRSYGVFRRELSTDVIPDLSKEPIVFSIDNFGNIKTSLTDESPAIKSLKLGDSVSVTINGITHTVRYGRGLGDVEEGGLVLAKGSTLHDPANPDRRQYDIYQNNGDAAACFRNDNGRPARIGGIIEIEPIDSRSSAGRNGKEAVVR
ncbi:MAG: hypothetical protein J5J00_02750 [Deltaproteobacteria bacterium]|nr:hypothetical protein [Deltaproteobacteria bacterium]